MFEKVAAGLALTVCLAWLVNLALGPVRRERVLGWVKVKGLRGPRSLWQRRAHRDAARHEAEQAISRARRDASRGEWDGNVYRPTSFRERGRKRPPPH